MAELRAGTPGTAPSLSGCWWSQHPFQQLVEGETAFLASACPGTYQRLCPGGRSRREAKGSSWCCLQEVWDACCRVPIISPCTRLLSEDLEVIIPFLGMCPLDRMCQSRAGIRAWDGSSCNHGRVWASEKGKGGLNKVALDQLRGKDSQISSSRPCFWRGPSSSSQVWAGFEP